MIVNLLFHLECGLGRRHITDSLLEMILTKAYYGSQIQKYNCNSVKRNHIIHKLLYTYIKKSWKIQHDRVLTISVSTSVNIIKYSLYGYVY